MVEVLATTANIRMIIMKTCALLLFLFAAGPLLVHGCQLTLYIDGAQSVFNFTGVGNSSLLQNIDLVPGYENQNIGLLGSMQFRSRGGCPSTQRQLERLLSSGDFNLKSNKDLRVYPNNVTIFASIFARLDFLNMEFDYRWREIEAQGKGVVEGNTTLEIVQGAMNYTVDPSLGFDVEPGQVRLENLTSVQIQEAQISIRESREMSLKLSDVLFSFMTEFETGIELLPSVEAIVNLTGNIVASGFIECSDVDCGENGRCVALDSGENACECACSWTGDVCEIPSGFCDLYGNPESPPITVPSPSPTAPLETRRQRSTSANLERQCAQLFDQRRCPDQRSVYDINSEQCQCVDGWRGNDCDLCEPGDSCPEFFESGAACVVDAVYHRRSGKKIYECDVRSAGFDAFIGNHIKFECNTTGPRFYDQAFQEALKRGETFDPVGNTPFCKVDFILQGTTPVNCTAWACKFRPGSTNVVCDKMLCDCEDCGSIRGLVDGITTTSLDCNDQNQCEVSFGGLSITVNAPCIIGECLLPSNPDFKVTLQQDDSFKMNWDIFIIAMPLVVVIALFLIIAIPAMHMARHLSHRTRLEYLTKAEKTERKIDGMEIRFVDVRCEVPIRSSRQKTTVKSVRSHLTSITGSKRRTEIGTRAEGMSLRHGAATASGFKTILNGITGTVHRGELVGVMGPTGGGKTTFLSIVCRVSADRMTRRHVTGTILVNGRKSGNWMKRHVAFVPQDDKLIATLTVRESLMYSAVLRKPGCSMTEIKRKVNQMLEELSLWAVEHSQVGGVRNRRGVSGGERRRVTIGMEMVTDPNLIIMDEPTSGLDSFAALNLMQTLKDICRRGRTVILSVHQPTPVMLDMLDQVLLLAQGFQVYMGPPGKAAEFFQRHGHGREDDRVHIAEHMLQVASTTEKLSTLLASLHSTQQRAAENVTATDPPASESNVHEERPNRQSVIVTLSVLIWRGFFDIVRNPALLLAHMVVAVLISIFCGGIFFDASLDIEGAQNRLGAAFFVLAFLGFWSLTIVDLLHVERGIVARETSSGYYNPYLYLMSKILLDSILLRILPSVLLTLPFYFMMGLQRTVEKFVIFLLTVSTFNLTVGLLAMSVTLLAPTAGTASLLINTFLLLGLLFAGHLVNIPSMPKAVRWLHHLSPFHYGFQVLAVNEMVGLDLNFVVPGLADVEGIGGDIFLRTVGIEDQDITRDLVSFTIYYGVALILTCISMWLSLHMHKFQQIRSFFRRSN